MAFGIKTVALAAATVAVNGVAAEVAHGAECTPCAGTTGTCEIKSKVNFFAGETGYFEFEGCDGVNPTLLLTVGRTYKFDQSDDTNWYHLLGFAYEADGAHVPVDELEPGIPPGDSACTDTLSCPAPMYFMNGEYQGTYSNIAELAPINGTEDFGLDAVEPLFFHPLGDWQGYGPMATYLNFDTVFDLDFFYFCHIHSGMSGRVKLLDESGNRLSVDNSPALPYEYDDISEFDLECGTFNLTDFQPEDVGNSCPSTFLCPNEGTEFSTFATCLNAMNCHMMASMTTRAVGISELFCHQMIPHHQNAVNMAKSLLKQHSDTIKCDLSGPQEEGDVVSWACDLLPILLSIINTQNSQIIDMQDVLGLLAAPEYSNCDVDFSDIEISRRLEGRVTPRKLEGAFESGIDCKPCADTLGECEVVLKVDLLAGERGYYTVDGCAGVNPTLHLSINRTYKFDQTDNSNWFHLIGFSYFADGAHAGVDELEPGIPPGDSDCADTFSCPAPMYFMNGEYQGGYSNIPDLIVVPDPPSDDFGLNEVEPRFFHPLGDWEGYGPFVTYLNFDTSFDKDIFYFCHVHSAMTGRIKLLDEDGSMLNTEDIPEIGYEYDIISEYDSECGTFGLDSFQLPNDNCPEQFVCDAGDGALGSFAGCIDSMDCAMMQGMTTPFGGEKNGPEYRDDVILFLRQMIPHHENAVNMAKALLKSGDAVCDLSGPVEEGSDISPECLLDPIIRDIINGQNKQIQTMRSILKTFGEEENVSCDAAEDESCGFFNGFSAAATFAATMTVGASLL